MPEPVGQELAKIIKINENILMESEDANGGGERWLRSGIGVVGNLALGVVSSVSSGAEAGAVIGAATGLMSVAAEMLSRTLSQNENRRVRNVATLAIEEFSIRIKEGLRPREDGFFDFDINTRRSGAEIFEGVLQIARGEYEENKLPYLAYLYVSIAFTDSVSRGEANRLICQLESVTYRKICILTAISQKSDVGLAWRPNCFNLSPGSDEFAGLMQDCFELETQGLVQENCDQSPSNGMHSWAFVVPAHLDLTLHGKKLIDFAQLAKSPEKDTLKIHEHMRMGR